MEKNDFENLGHYESEAGWGDFDHCSCDILRDKTTGKFYLCGSGGARTYFGRPCDGGGRVGSSGTIWVPDDVAFMLIESGNVKK